MSEVKKEEEEKVDKNVYEQVRSDMQQERKDKRVAQDRITSLEQELAAKQEKQAKEGSEESLQKRLIQSEANSAVALKMTQDPNFKERAVLVQEVMRETGKNLEEADREVKAKLFDQLEQGGGNFAPIQMGTSATQEKTDWKPSGDVMKDMQDNPEVDPMLKQAIARKFPT